MRIREEELKIRKNRIIMEAFRLFCEKGIEQVTLSEIAGKAKVGDATIYRYFVNKPKLVLSTLNVLWKSIGERLDEKIKETQHYDSLTGLEQVKAQLESCRQLYLENADYVLFSYESKLYLQRNNIKISAMEYDALMESIKHPFLAALSKGKQDGTIPAAQANEDLFYAIWGTVRGYIVKIVIYRSLCLDESPWESRYYLVEDGILCALSKGWKQPDDRCDNHTRPL